MCLSPKNHCLLVLLLSLCCCYHATVCLSKAFVSETSTRPLLLNLEGHLQSRPHHCYRCASKGAFSHPTSLPPATAVFLLQASLCTCVAVLALMLLFYRLRERGLSVVFWVTNWRACSVRRRWFSVFPQATISHRTSS